MNTHSQRSFDDGSPLLAHAIRQLRELDSSSNVALTCEPSVEGVVSSVGLTYLARLSPSRVRLVRETGCQARLGEVIVQGLNPSWDETVALARRVLVGFEQKQNREAVRRLVLACASDDPRMPETVHRFMRAGFSQSTLLVEDPADEVCHALNALARQVDNEREHMRQFVRFSRMADGSFMSVFRPNANMLPLTTGYFVQRLGNERFLIVDPLHHIATFYTPKQKRFGTVKLDQSGIDKLVARSDLADNEASIQALWQCFYERVGLPGRDASQRGYDLRTHWMPQRFWSELTELAVNVHEKTAPDVTRCRRITS